MRKLKLLIAAVALTLGGVITANANITVYVQADAAPYLYVWDSSDNKLNGDWPGTQMTETAEVQGVTFYKSTFDAESINIIINNGSGNQTANIEGITEDVYYTYDGNKTATVYEFPVEYTVTFVNGLGWENVYAYVWTGEGDSATKLTGDWPGTGISKTSTAEFYGTEYDVYTCTFSATQVPEKIIFNNNSAQTGDLAFENGKQYLWGINEFAEGKYYLKNIASGKFWGNGNSWGTQASLVDYASYITLHPQPDGTYTMESQVSNGGTNYYFGGDFMDSGEVDKVTLTISPVDGGYTIANGTNYYGYDGSSTVLGKNLDANSTQAVWTITTYEEQMATMMATLDTATEENGVDATFLILDPNFDRNHRSASAWVWEKSGQNSTIGGPSENRTSYGCEFWNNTFDIHQDITLPNGVYEFSIAGYGTNNTTYIYANDTEAVFVNTTRAADFNTALNNIADGQYTGNTTGKVNVIGRKLRVGVKRTTNSDADWAVFDNARLTYYGPVDISVYVAAYTAKLTEAKALLDETMSASYKAAIEAAITANTGVDETSQEALENAIDALTEAIATANVSVNSYKLLAAGGSLPDNSLGGWTCTNSQEFVINTWSVEGNSDGTGMVTPFIQNWCNKSGVLGDGEIYYTLPGLDPGIYKFSALIRAYSESGNAPDGASLFAGDRDVAFSTGNSFEYNGMKGIYDNYAMTAQVGDDGVFKFGVKITSANFNWMAFKNCKVEYVGAAITAESVEALYAEMPEGKMNKDVRTAAETAYTAAKETVGLTTYEALDKAIVAAKASAEAYAAAIANLDKVKDEIDAELKNTNVYTQESYDAVITNNYTKYEAEELTDTEANDLANGVSGTSVTGWHNPFLIDNILLSAWDTNPDFVDAPYYINSWSTEGASDGTNFKVPFFEYYTGANAALGEKTMTATMTGLEPGTYKVTAWVRVATKENLGTADGNGITMQVNDGTAVDVTKGDVKVTGANSNQRIHGNFTAVGTVGEDGELKIKFNVVADNNIHWMSFKNVKYTAFEPVYAVVGSSTDIFTGEWDAATATDILTQDGNAYTKTYTDQVLTKQDVEFKVIMKESAESTEALAWYPESNQSFSIPVNGKYNVTFTFDGTNVTGTATKTAEAVTIGEKGWATTVTNSALDFSESGIKAYTATVSDNTVTLAKVENVQAETGLVMQGTADTYYLPVIESSETEKGDLMFSSTETYDIWQPTDGTVNTFYGLTVNDEEKAQFVKLNDGTIPAQKAFLMVNSPAEGARVLKVVFAGDATGIDSIIAEKNAEGIYNLNGQRVAAPAKGLYIVNGKKVVLK